MIDLTKVGGCYTKELKSHLKTINKKYETASLDDFKKYVLKVIEPAKFNKVAKPRFTMYVNNCKSNKDLLNLVYNSLLAGEYYRQ